MVKYLNNNNSSGFSQWMANQQKAAADKKKAPGKFSGFLWWMVIFLGAYLAYSYFFGPKPEVKDVVDQPEIVNVASVPVTNVFGDKISADVQGLRISKIELKDYKANKNSDDNIKLLSGTNEFAEIGLLASGTTAPTADTMWKSARLAGAGVMTWRNADKIDFKRTVVTEDYIITITDEIKNNSNKDVAFAPYARMVRAGSQKAVAVNTGGIAYVNSDMEKRDWNKLDKKPYVYQTTTGFVGFADQYWENVISVNALDQTIRMKKVGTQYQADIAAAPIQVAAGKTATIETKIFAGPREQTVLSVAATSIPGLNKTMDYGWFRILSQPMLWALNAIHGFVLNYGVAIILLTLCLRLLMWPLTRKSYTSMAAMQKMQPEMARIQKLYANDKARMQMEMMKLYQTHKTSPMSGCLPMLIQIPIFFALYKALIISVPMRHAGFLWMSDLSVMDPYFILPILMGLTMWFQQKLQTSAQPAGGTADTMAQTQKVMKWMPILFTVMFAWMPSGLVLYWTVSNLFGILQMYIIKKTMNK